MTFKGVCKQSANSICSTVLHRTVLCEVVFFLWPLPPGFLAGCLNCFFMDDAISGSQVELYIVWNSVESNC